MRWHRIQAMLMKYWYISRNSLDRIFDVVYWPVIGVIVFGFTTLYLEKAAGVPNVIIFLLGGMLMWNLFERISQDVGVYILEEFWSHNVANTFVTPLKESELFVALCIVGFIRSLISFTVMVGIALIGYQFNFFNGGLISLLFVIPLFLFAWGLGLLMSGMIFRFGMRIQVFVWGVSYLLQPLAAAYYPVETLPVVLQKAALFTPLVYVFQGFRLSYGGAFSVQYLLAALGLSVVYLVIGYFIFTRCVKKARRSGLLTKY